jgi:penicillin-binding protein 1A
VSTHSPYKPSLNPGLASNLPNAQPSLGRMLLRITVVVGATTSVCAGLGLYLWLQTLGIFNLDKKAIAGLADYKYKDNSIVYDRGGAKIGEFFNKYHAFVAYSDLPQHFINALIATEDHTFFEHHGVDYRGILRAVLLRLKSSQTSQGASTITQQLARSIFLSNEKTVERKVKEIAYALEIERHVPKEKIIELYVNTMFLGNGAYGVGAAAQRYFGKRMQDTSPAESALIAGLFQSPSRYNPKKYPERAKSRQLKVLSAMRHNGMITQKVLREISSDRLVYRDYSFLNAQSASWFVDYIRETLPNLGGFKGANADHSGYRIYTTLDSNLQKIAERSIRSYDSRLTELSLKTGKVRGGTSGAMIHAGVEASMLVTDPQTGDVIAMVGGRDFKKSQFNRASSAMRSPGSAFKPIVYTEALIHGSKWSDVLYVSPVNIANYRPKSSEDDYFTETTMLRAFYRSMNAPALNLAEKVGLPAIIKRAKLMGIQSPIKEEFGSAIGSSDVSMMDLARLYGTYASGGLLTEINPILKITNGDGDIIWERAPLNSRRKRVLNAQISYLMTQGMRSVLSVGTGSASSDLASFAAGKTGTSNDSADNWFCGFTPDLVSIVWVGTDEHAPIFANVSGGAVALPIWDQFIRGAMASHRPRDFLRPPGIIESQVDPRYGRRTAGGATMYFLQNAQPEDTDPVLENIEQSASGGFRNVFRN